MGDAFGVSKDVGNNAGAITEIECSQYDSQASGYVSVYNNATDFTATSHTYANDFAYFKRAYCGTSTTVQTAHCYIVSRNGEAKSKVVVADCAQGLGAKIYFVQAGGAMVAGTQTSLPANYDTYVSFAAQCNQCSGTVPGTWADITSPKGYQQKTDQVRSAKFCNICKLTDAAPVFRCAIGYYGPTNQTSPTGCVSCPSGATTSSNGATTVSSCRCKSGYYGTASAGKACTACPSYATCAGGNGSTFVCGAGYFGVWDTSKPFVGCFACPDNATCTEDNYTCNAGYYADFAVGTTYRYSCTACPESSMNIKTDGTAISGIPVNMPGVSMYSPQANHSMYGITSCYLPAGSVYGFEDIGGIYVFDTNCYFSPEANENE